MPRTSKISKKQSQRVTHEIMPGGKELAGVLVNPPLSFSRQAYCKVWVAGTPVSVQETAAGFAVIFSRQVDPTTDVTAWSTRFGNTFLEYRILGVEMKVRPVHQSGLGNGCHVSWWDETGSGSTTTQAMAIRMDTKLRPSDVANEKSCYNLYWQPQDPEDMAFQPHNGGSIPVTFRLYSDSTYFGLNVSTGANMFTVQPWYLIQFRSLK